MAAIASTAADAAVLSPPPEPECLGGGDDGNDGHDDTFSPLLDLVERFPDLFAQKVLAHLDPIDRTFLAQTGGACRVAVAASDLLRAGTRSEVLGKGVWRVRHKVRDFCTSVERLAWAKNNGCPWVERTCAIAAQGGRLDMLHWARKNDCPWDARTCAYAAAVGHLEVLKWARENHCPWNCSTCTHAAKSGHLVGRCRLTLSKPVLKVPLVSVLEATI
jgi:hypothetical protein